MRCISTTVVIAIIGGALLGTMIMLIWAVMNERNAEKRIEQISDMAVGLSRELVSLESEYRAQVRDLKKELEELQKVFDNKLSELMDAQSEREREEARSEAAWADGLNSIVNYGANYSKLNTEGAYGGK